MLIEYTAEYTVYNTKDVSQMFISSEWNRRNLSLDVGDGGPVTLFAATNERWFQVNGEDITRLSTDKWKPHQLDMLRHMMIQGNWTYQMLMDKLTTEGGSYNLTSLAGQNLTIELNTLNNTVSVAGGNIVYTDIVGVDGYVSLIPQGQGELSSHYSHTIPSFHSSWTAWCTSRT